MPDDAAVLPTASHRAATSAQTVAGSVLAALYSAITTREKPSAYSRCRRGVHTATVAPKPWTSTTGARPASLPGVGATPAVATSGMPVRPRHADVVGAASLS